MRRLLILYVSISVMGLVVPRTWEDPRVVRASSETESGQVPDTMLSELPDGFRPFCVWDRSPDILTCPASFLTGFGAGFDVEAEAEVGLWQGHVQGVDLITQRHHRLCVARSTELIQMDMELARG
jgi:hypothetical protein